MEQMRRNDDAITAATVLFADKNADLRDMRRRLDIQAHFLDDQLQLNRERDSQIVLLERDVSKLRAEYAQEQARSPDSPSCPCKNPLLGR
jgi:hypothetical protein